MIFASASCQARTSERPQQQLAATQQREHQRQITPEQISSRFAGMRYGRIGNKAFLVASFELTNNASFATTRIRGIASVRRVEDGTLEVENWPFSVGVISPGASKAIHIRLPIELTEHNVATEDSPAHFYSPSLKITEISTSPTNAEAEHLNLVEFAE
jgi:hypothetical protein